MYRNPTYAAIAAGEAFAHFDLGHLTSSALPIPSDNTLSTPVDGQSIQDLDSGRRLQIMDAGREARLSQDPISATSRKSQYRNHEATQPQYTRPPHVPTYLRGSRYIERVDTAYRKFQRHSRQQTEKTLQDGDLNNQVSGRSSRVPSSTHAVGLKQDTLAASRAPVSDVRELLGSTTPAPVRPVLDIVSPLPTRWSEQDKFPSLVLSHDGTEVLLKDEVKSTDDAAAVKADFPIPKECGIYYFEITLLSKGMVGIGLSGAKSSVARLPGWEQQSWGYHGDDGLLYCCSATAGKPYGPSFSEHDVIGCGIDFRLHHIFFTKNGVFLGYPCGDAAQEVICDRLYPTIGMKKKNDNVKTNFGQMPFVFDIDSMVEATKRSIQREITNSTTVRNPSFIPQQETEDIQRLVAQYLSHEGHVDTAQLFATEIQQQRQHLLPGSVGSAISDSIHDDSAVNRQRIRAAILAGDIDLALTLIDQHHPEILHQRTHQDIYFRLKCRKFTEMVIKFNQGHQEHETSDNSPLTTNTSAANDAYGHDRIVELKRANADSSISLNAMNVDDSPPTSNDYKEITRSAGTTILLPDDNVVNYGMELSQEFSADTRPEVKEILDGLFAPLCYPHRANRAPDEPSDTQQRTDLAEEINGAILASQGKPREALLNTHCAQTEVLLDLLAAKGGSATMINVKRDFLAG